MTERSRREALSAIGWLVLALPIVLINSVMQGSLQGRERFVSLNVATIVGNVLNQLLPLSVAWAGHTQVNWLVPAALCSRVAVFILLSVQAKRHIPLCTTPQIRRAHLLPLANYGGWVSIVVMLEASLTAIERPIIGATSGAKAITYFAVPYNVVSQLMIISGSIGSALFPRFASVEHDDAKSLTISATESLVAIMTPAVIVALAVIHPFLLLWVGAEIADRASGVGEIILVGIWINCLVVLHSTLLHAHGRLKPFVRIYLIELPLYFVMLRGCIDRWGVLGAAVASTIRVAIDAILILSVSGAVRQTTQRNAAGMLLVLIGAAIGIGTAPLSYLRWLGMVLLLLASLLLGWKRIIGATRLVFTQRVG